MYTRRPPGRGPAFAGFGTGFGPPPRDVLVLLAVLFVTFSLNFFRSTQIIPLTLKLTSLVWQNGFVWQLVTYPYIGTPQAPFWFLLSLFILYRWFSRDVYGMLGRRRFWQMLVLVTLGAALAAVVTQLLGSLIPGAVQSEPFGLMQGQFMLMTVMIAAFATLRGDATILAFFVLPIQAKYFLALEILVAFMAFLTTRDLAGFVGICAAVGLSYAYLTRLRPERLWRELRLRFERWWIEQKLSRMRRKSGLRVVKDDEPPEEGPWVH